MKLDVMFAPGEVVAGELAGRVAVVIDVLRATSTIVESLANGARAVVPAPGIDEAVRIAQSIGRDRVLLCGERRTLPIEGFDLGNSPREFTPERVAGRTIVMTTTNGTAALLASANARRVLVGSFLNLDAVAGALESDGGPAAIVCAGREGRFSLDDAVGAGMLVARLADRLGTVPELNDAGIAAEDLARRYEANVPALLERTAAGRQLIESGLAEDIAFCAAVDRHDVLPELRERQVTL